MIRFSYEVDTKSFLLKLDINEETLKVYGYIVKTLNPEYYSEGMDLKDNEIKKIMDLSDTYPESEEIIYLEKLDKLLKGIYESNPERWEDIDYFN